MSEDDSPGEDPVGVGDGVLVSAVAVQILRRRPEARIVEPKRAEASPLLGPIRVLGSKHEAFELSVIGLECDAHARTAAQTESVGAIASLLSQLHRRLVKVKESDVGERRRILRLMAVFGRHIGALALRRSPRIAEGGSNTDRYEKKENSERRHSVSRKTRMETLQRREAKVCKSISTSGGFSGLTRSW